MEDELLIKIINKRIELNGYISRQAYELAAKCVDEKRKVELELFILYRVLDDNIKFPIQFEKFFFEYLLENYNFLINENPLVQDYSLLLLAIKRDKTLNELGI
jgi:hypothetical protein